MITRLGRTEIAMKNGSSLIGTLSVAGEWIGDQQLKGTRRLDVVLDGAKPLS